MSILNGPWGRRVCMGQASRNTNCLTWEWGLCALLLNAACKSDTANQLPIISPGKAVLNETLNEGQAVREALQPGRRLATDNSVVAIHRGLTDVVEMASWFHLPCCILRMLCDMEHCKPSARFAWQFSILHQKQKRTHQNPTIRSTPVCSRSAWCLDVIC